MSWLKRFARTITWATMVGSVGLMLSGAIACAEETFACCECKFPTCQAPDPANPGAGIPAPQTVCTCGQEYTYETCGTYCFEQVPSELLAKEAAMVLMPMTCGTPDASGNYVITPQTGTVLAKNSCSVGSPVGE